MKVKGTVHYKVFEHGQLREEHTIENLVVDLGKDSLCKLVSGDDQNRYVDQIGFGTGSAAPSSADSALTNQYKKGIAGYNFPAVNQVDFNWVLGLNENNGVTIAEFGLFDQQNNLFARRLAVSPIVKNNTISISGVWTLTF